MWLFSGVVAWTRWTSQAAHRHLPQGLASCHCGHRCLSECSSGETPGDRWTMAVRPGNAFLCVPGQVEASPSPGQGQGCSCSSLITCPSPVVEGGSSLQGASASGPIPGCASEQPGPGPAHSHRGIAVQMRFWSLPASPLDPNTLVPSHGTYTILFLGTLLKRGTDGNTHSSAAQLTLQTGP